jgi:hypothetical protein
MPQSLAKMETIQLKQFQPCPEGMFVGVCLEQINLYTLILAITVRTRLMRMEFRLRGLKRKDVHLLDTIIRNISIRKIRVHRHPYKAWFASI